MERIRSVALFNLSVRTVHIWFRYGLQIFTARTINAVSIQRN